MTDDLRLDVARALGWVFEESLAKPQETTEWWRRAHRDTIYVERDNDGNVVSCNSCHADWTTSLGACQEVLDAIEGREWKVELRGDKHTWQAAIFPLNDWANGGWSLGLATAPTLPEALCRAFVEAVEANGE